MKKIVVFLGVALVLLLAVLLINTYTTPSKQLKTTGKRIDYPLDNAAIARLQSAIRIKTISYDDRSKTDTTSFLALHTLIDSAFPLVKQQLEKTVINKFSLIYKWKGKNPTENPSTLYAHLDVVPVESVNRSAWLHDPWAGDIADSFIWGRGTLDDKSSAFAILEAAESLLAQQIAPTNDVYFVFGHDEEVGGEDGAGAVADFFRKNGVKTQLHLDEGGMCTSGMVPFIDKPMILIGTAEKGYMTVDVKVKIKGGHSSKPEKETATGVLIRALAKIEQYKFPKELSPSVADFVDYAGPEMSMPFKVIFTNKWLFRPLILSEYEKVGGDGNALIRTTAAITLFDAGVKENLIPSEANATVNFRLMTGHTGKEVLAEIKKIVNDDRVKITPRGNTMEPSPITATSSKGFKTTQQICAEVFPDAAVSPFLMIGATDSKHFEDIAAALIRCLPLRMNKDQLHSIHGVNEKIKMADYMEMIVFYKNMISKL